MDVREVESLCCAMYAQDSNKQLRDAALAKLEPLYTLPALQTVKDVLNDSSEPSTVMFATQALKRILSDNWNLFPPAELEDLHQGMITIINKWADRSDVAFVAKSAVSTYAFLCKNAILDVPSMTDAMFALCGTSRGAAEAQLRGSDASCLSAGVVLNSDLMSNGGDGRISRAAAAVLASKQRAAAIAGGLHNSPSPIRGGGGGGMSAMNGTAAAASGAGAGRSAAGDDASIFAAIHRPTKYEPNPETGEPPLLFSLAMLKAIVDEVGTVNAKRTLSTHRKIVNYFRDTVLLHILEAAIGALKYVRDCINQAGGSLDALNEDYVLAATELMQAVTGFDFVCAFPDDMDEEPTTVQVPRNWREVLVDPETTDLVWFLYSVLPSPHNNTCLEVIIDFASTRRSLFLTARERGAWINGFLENTTRVIQGFVGLQDPDTAANFCRLLNRIKPNTSISELVEQPTYPKWIECVTRFCCQCFDGWRDGHVATLSLLSMWSRLVGAASYIDAKSPEEQLPTQFNTHVPVVIESYISTRLDSAAFMHRGDTVSSLLEDPLLEKETLILQLDNLALIIRSELPAISGLIWDILGPFGDQFCDSTRRCLKDPVLEAQVAWIFYICGSVLKQFGKLGPSTPEVDGDIICNCFDYIGAVNERVASLGIDDCSNSLIILELSVIYFLQQFRAIFIGDAVKEAQHVCTVVQSRIGTQTVSPAEMQAKLLEFVVAKIHFNLRHWSHNDHVLRDTVALFTDLQTNYTTSRQMLELHIVRHMLSAHGMREFPFLNGFVKRRSRIEFRKSVAMLLFMEQISEESFAAYLTSVHEALHHLAQHFAAGGDASVLNDPTAREIIIGALCDLRGTSMACVSHRAFRLIYDFIMPDHFETITRLAELNTSDSQVETQILRFAVELAYDRSKRVNFEPHCVKGYKLFRAIGRLIAVVTERKIDVLFPVEVGSLASVTPSVGSGVAQDPESYEVLHKSIYLCMGLIHRTLTGNYVNFGIFQMYGDATLEQMLTTAAKLITVTPFDHLLQYKKLAIETFALMQQLFSCHMVFAASLPTATVLHMMHCIEGSMLGVRLSSSVLTSSAQAITALLTWVHRCEQRLEQLNCANAQRGGGGGSSFSARRGAGTDGGGAAICVPSPLASPLALTAPVEPEELEAYQSMRGHFEHDPEYFRRMLDIVFSNVVFEEGANQYTLSQPLLPLILTHPDLWRAHVDSQLARAAEVDRHHGDAYERQNADTKRARLKEAFDTLELEIDGRLERKSKERFQQALTAFRQVAKMVL